MPSIWWTIPALAGLIGLVLLGAGIGRIFRFKMMTGLSRFLFGSAFVSAAVVAVLFGLNLQTYSRLTHERIAARITLEKRADQDYLARVEVPDDNGVLAEPLLYELTGDAFRMDVRLLKWRPWANVAGYDSIYRLDRIQGRFDDVEDENTRRPTAFDLAPDGSRNAGVDIYTISRQNAVLKKFNAVDAIYGAGAYAPMVDGAVYDMMVTQSGLVPRPKNDIAVQAALQWGAPVGAARQSPQVSVSSGRD